MAGRILAGLALVLTAACAGTSTPLDRRAGSSSARAPSVVIPNAVAGDAAARGEAQAADQPCAPPPTGAAAARIRAADALWRRAEQLDAKNPRASAPIFKQIVERYPEYEKAAEARFREGRAYYRARIYDEAVPALQDYMLIAPVNQHLAQVEEMLYESGRCGLRTSSGFLGLGDSKALELNALKYVAQTFPAGNYPDDSLLALGEYYFQDEDYAAAALHYRELLIRYPDSEWSFRARLRLADTYMARDQGTPYTAGFVQIDPRDNVPAEMAMMAGPVQPAVLLALEQYELFLQRMKADPSRSAEYSCEIAYATRRAQEARESLACKELDRGDWYQRRGDLCGALTFWRLAASRTGTRSGQAARRRLASYRQPVEQAPIAAPPAAGMPTGTTPLPPPTPVPQPDPSLSQPLPPPVPMQPAVPVQPAPGATPTSQPPAAMPPPQPASTPPTGGPGLPPPRVRPVSR